MRSRPSATSVPVLPASLIFAIGTISALSGHAGLALAQDLPGAQQAAQQAPQLDPQLAPQLDPQQALQSIHPLRAADLGGRPYGLGAIIIRIAPGGGLAAAELEKLAVAAGGLTVVPLLPEAGLHAIKVIEGDEQAVRLRLIEQAGSAAARAREGMPVAPAAAPAAAPAPAAQALDGPILSADLNWLLRPTGMRRQDQPTPPAPVSPSSSPPSGPISPPAPLNPQGQVTPWGVQAVGAPTYWAALGASGRGAGVRVAVLDTGLDVGHPDLPAPIIGRNYDPARSASNISDHSGHGTHVAGTILARDNGIGVVGVAPLASLLVYRVCYVISNQTACPQSAIISALGAATNDGAKVFNLSLGGAGGSADDPMCEAVMHATGDHRVVVVSAGNDALIGNPVNYPAACPFAVSVAALNTNLTRADFSTFNDFVDIAAPGVSVLSTYPRALWSPGYDALQGTSVAAPHVAGVAALLMGHFGHHPRPNPTRFAMLNGALDLGPTGRDDFFGSGLVRSAESAGFRAQRSDVNIERTRFEVLDVSRSYLGDTPGMLDLVRNESSQGSLVNNWGDVIVNAQGNVATGDIDPFGQPYTTPVSGVFLMEAGQPSDSPNTTVPRSGYVQLVANWGEPIPDRTTDSGEPMQTVYGVNPIAISDGTDRLSTRDALIAFSAGQLFPAGVNRYQHTGLMIVRPTFDGLFSVRKRTVAMTGDRLPVVWGTPAAPDSARRLLHIRDGWTRMNNRGQVLFHGGFGDATLGWSQENDSLLFGEGLFYYHNDGQAAVPLVVTGETPPPAAPDAPLWVGGRYAQIQYPLMNDRGDVVFLVRGEFPEGGNASAIWKGERISSNPVRYSWTRIAMPGMLVPTEPGDVETGVHQIPSLGDSLSSAGYPHLDAAGRVLFGCQVQAPSQFGGSDFYYAVYLHTPGEGLRRLARSNLFDPQLPPAPGFPAQTDARFALDYRALPYSTNWLLNSNALFGTSMVRFLGETVPSLPDFGNVGLFTGTESLGPV